MTAITISNKAILKNQLFDFDLPKRLQCSLPTEVRGMKRDEVKLMVSYIHSDQVEHTIFRNIVDYFEEGDVLVVNTSGTLKAALKATRQDGTKLSVHFSTKLREGLWTIELRKITEEGTKRFYKAQKGEILNLEHGGQLKLIEPYYDASHQKHLQLWVAITLIEGSLKAYLEVYGTPIRYSYIKDIYPQSYYQTIFATEMGSAEMPSAGRAFTHPLITKLIAKGVQIVPILLHTGVASLETDEKPYDEYYRISETTATTLNLARRRGKRIIAVGTTVIRALETVTSSKGITKSGEGWTDIFITPQRGLYSVNGMLTGMHEPRASHLYMLDALAGKKHLNISYKEAIKEEYLWHEFGDLHLIMP